MADAYRTVDKADDLRAGGRSPVRIKEPVHAEVAVVLPLPVVTAVGVASVLVQHRVVHHFPDAAADQVVVSVDLLPVGLGISRSDAHGMRVFAQEIRPVVERFLLSLMDSDVMDHLNARIHLAADVVGDPAAVDGALVVDRESGVRLQVVVHRVGVGISAGFISQAPHHDGRVGVDAVPQIQPLDAVHVMRPPLRIVGNGVVGGRELHGEGAVRLQVVLVHDIDAVLVRQFQKKRIRRVVGRADGVDVEFLAQKDVPLDLVRRQGIAVFGACVVMIDPVEFDLPAVDQEVLRVFDLHGLEAELLLHAAGGRLVIDRIEDRVLRAPLDDVKIRKFRPRASAFGRYGAGPADPVSFEGKGDVGILIDLRSQGQGVGASGLFVYGVDVRNVCRFGDPQQHVAENAVVPEHVLALQIGAVAPAVYDGQKFIFSRMEMSGEIEFGGIVRALRVADEFPVEIQIQTAGDAEEGNDVTLFRIGDRELLPVDTHEIILLSRILAAVGELLVDAQPGEDLSDLFGSGDYRRLIGELIADIDIEGPVVSPELPAGRHVDGHEIHLICIQHRGKLHGAGIETEIPVSVQAEHLFGAVAFLLRRYGVGLRPVRIGDKIGSSGKLVHAEDLKCTVVVWIQLILHGSSLCILRGLWIQKKM